MNFKVRKLHVIFIGYIKGYLVVGGYLMNNTEWVKESKAYEVEAKKNEKSQMGTVPSGFLVILF